MTAEHRKMLMHYERLRIALVSLIEQFHAFRQFVHPDMVFLGDLETQRPPWNMEAEVRLQEGRMMLKESNFQEAIKHFEDALRHDSTCWGAELNWAIALGNMARKPQMVESGGPRSALFADIEMRDSQHREEYLTKAGRLLEDLLSKVPEGRWASAVCGNLAWVAYIRESILGGMEESERAKLRETREYWNNQALTCDTKNDDARASLGLLYLMRGALADTQVLWQDSRHDEGFLLSLGNMLRNMGDEAQAALQSQWPEVWEAVQLDP